MNRLAPEILGTHVRMDVDIAGADFDNQEAHKTYPICMTFPVEDAILSYRHCHTQGLACGFIHPEADLSKLKVLSVPHWGMWKLEWTARVDAFDAQGGTLILSALTAMRDSHNRIPTEQAPRGGLSALADVKVHEFGRLAGPDATGLLPPWPDRYVGAHVPGSVPDAASSGRNYASVSAIRNSRRATFTRSSTRRRVPRFPANGPTVGCSALRPSQPAAMARGGWSMSALTSLPNWQRN